MFLDCTYEIVYALALDSLYHEPMSLFFNDF